MNVIICRAIAHDASVLYKTTELQAEVGLQAEVLYKTTSVVQNEHEANKWTISCHTTFSLVYESTSFRRQYSFDISST